MMTGALLQARGLVVISIFNSLRGTCRMRCGVLSINQSLLEIAWCMTDCLVSSSQPTSKTTSSSSTVPSSTCMALLHIKMWSINMVSYIERKGNGEQVPEANIWAQKLTGLLFQVNQLPRQDVSQVKSLQIHACLCSLLKILHSLCDV